MRLFFLLVTIFVTLVSKSLSAIDLPTNWKDLPEIQKIMWIISNVEELTEIEFMRLLGGLGLQDDFDKYKNLSAAELLHLLTDPNGIPLLSAYSKSQEVGSDEIRLEPIIITSKEKIKTLLEIDSEWRRLVGTSLVNGFGRVSEHDFNRVADLVEKMEKFKSSLLILELEETPFKRLLARQLTDNVQIVSSLPESLEQLADFFYYASIRTENEKLKRLFYSISRYTAIFHLEFISFRTIERFFVFEMRRELALRGGIPDALRAGNDGGKDNAVVRAALALPGKKLSYNKKGHEAFVEILNRIVRFGEGREITEAENLYVQKAKSLLMFFEENKDLTDELLAKTSRVDPSEVPSILKRELSVKFLSGGKGGEGGEVERLPRGLGIKNSLLYTKNRFLGFVGNTLHFYTSILLADQFLGLTFYTGEYKDSRAPVPFFVSAKDLLFNIGAHIHFATFSLYAAANRSAYNGAIKGLVTKFPILKFLSGRNPVSLLFSEFVGFMPGMSANSGMWSSLEHSATPSSVWLLSRGYFHEAGRLAALVWSERIASASLGARMGSVTGVFYGMRVGQNTLISTGRFLLGRAAGAAAIGSYSVNPLVGFAWGVTTFALAGVAEHHLNPWFNRLEANSYIDSASEKLLDAENELISGEKLDLALREIPGMQDVIDDELRARDYDLSRFYEDCWASILNGGGEFGRLIGSIIDHKNSKFIVEKINELEELISIKERHILSGMLEERAEEEVEDALLRIEDLVNSFVVGFKYKKLENLLYLFERAARIRVYSVYVPLYYRDAKDLIAGNGAIDRAYFEYENGWKRESDFGASRLDFLRNIEALKVDALNFDSTLSQIPEGRGDAKQFIEDAKKEKSDIEEMLSNYSTQIANAAFSLELHKLMKMNFWKRCRDEGFLALDNEEQEKHKCRKQQILIENEWNALRAAPASRILVDNLDFYESTALFIWATDEAFKQVARNAFSSDFSYENIGWWSSLKTFSYFQYKSITPSIDRDQTPWWWLEPKIKEIGREKAEEFILHLDRVAPSFDHDLSEYERERSRLLLYKLWELTEKEGLADDLFLNSEIQASWIKALITGPLSGKFKGNDFVKAAIEVDEISERDWSVLLRYNNRVVSKNTYAARTSEELAFWLNGYVRAGRKEIGLPANRVLREWWLNEVVSAAQRSSVELEAIRAASQFKLPLPNFREGHNYSGYGNLESVVNPFTVWESSPFIAKRKIYASETMPSSIEELLNQHEENIEYQNVESLKEEDIKYLIQKAEWFNVVLLEPRDSQKFKDVEEEIRVIVEGEILLRHSQREARRESQLIDFAIDLYDYIILTAAIGADPEELMIFHLELFDNIKGEIPHALGAVNDGELSPAARENLVNKIKLLEEDDSADPAKKEFLDYLRTIK